MKCVSALCVPFIFCAACILEREREREELRGKEGGMASLFSCCGWHTHFSGLPSIATKPMLGLHHRPRNPSVPNLLQVQSLCTSSVIEGHHEGQLQGYWQHVQSCNSGRVSVQHYHLPLSQFSHFTEFLCE